MRQAVRRTNASDDGGDATPHLRRLAAALRQLRKSSGLTLAEISERTGLSISALSKVQNGQMSLTYDKLVSLSNGLGVDVTYFFAAEPPALAPAPDVAAPSVVMARRSVERAGAGAHISTPVYEYHYLASELSRKRMTPIYAEPKARSLEEFGELIRHPGEEFTTVLEGRIELHTEFYAPVTLEVGDSVYIDSTMGHAYLAAAEGPCRIMCVCSGMEPDLSRASEPASPARARPAAPVVRRAR
jgi:mannose-6-phosphate isomerase-like protein (cupin superfamily)